MLKLEKYNNDARNKCPDRLRNQANFGWIFLWAIFLMLCWVNSSFGKILPPPKDSVIFYSFVSKSSNLNVVFSADGRVIVGANQQYRIWVWRKGSGYIILPKAPVGYNYEFLKISKHGNALAGIFTGSWPDHMGVPQRAFLWTRSSGLRILPPLPSKSNVSFVALRHRSLFIGFSPKDCTKCRNGSSHGHVRFPIWKWNKASGYRRFDFEIPERFTVINFANDLSNCLVAIKSSGSKIGLLLQNGKFIPFHNTSKLVSDAGQFVESKNNEFVSFGRFLNNNSYKTDIWNSSGKFYNIPKEPTGCSDLTVRNITTT